MVDEDKEARNHSNISFDKFYVELHDCHSWIHKCSSLQELTHVGRWTKIPSDAPNFWWATSTLSNPHKFNYMDYTTNQGMSFDIREALLQVMSQSNSTRWEYIKMLKRKMVTPFELKQWVWPMIKWTHLTPMSICSNIGDLVAEHI